MPRGQDAYDVVVVGGGPVGCVTAIAHARRGASVALFEANPTAARRFAGEWIHPAGVAVLDRLRAGRLESRAPRCGYGFVLLPPGEAPLELAYADGVALACEHHEIVAALRDAAQRLRNVTYRSGAHVVRVAPGQVIFNLAKSKSAQRVRADRIVGADGRSSIVRRTLGLPEDSTVLSYMASIELGNVELPHEGFGHVILGGPGPALLYRVDENRIRGCLDVPASLGNAARRTSFLWEAFERVFPVELRGAFRSSLNHGRVCWAANRFRARTYFGRGRTFLVGDALGHVHPLSAAGMTMGFLDAVALAEVDDVTHYARRRASVVPELVSNVLLHALYAEEPDARAVRRALLERLRADRGGAQRMLDVLSGRDPNPRSFVATFLRASWGAAFDTVRFGGQGLGRAEMLAAQARWLKWPLAAMVPQPLFQAYRATSLARPR